jgi:hypothetical protein
VILTAVLAGIITLPLTPVVGRVVPPVLSADPCVHIVRCTEFAPGDITGDGVPDRVGYDWSRLTRPGTFAVSTVTIVVTSTDGHRYSLDTRQFGYFEGTYGNAPIDGVPGNEIATSWIPGAHTSMIQVITFRDGALRREQGWSVDAIQTYGGGVEWIPGESPTAPIMRQCQYDDLAMNGRPAYQTATVDYTWTATGWSEGPKAYAQYRNLDRIPGQCMRFNVPGMSRLPMLMSRR